MTLSRSLQTRVSRSRRAGRGFTLVELLVVIAIIALILGIALPALSRARDQARIVSMQATLRVISTGLEQFNNDLQGYPSSTPRPDMKADGPGSGDPIDYGAQLLVQALIGWDGLGYVDPNNPGTTVGQDWYNLDASNKPFIERFGPYIQSDSVDLKTKGELQVGTFVRVTDGFYGATSDNRVVVDIFRFQMPILYYRADSNGTAVAADVDQDTQATMTPFPAIYDFDDNDAYTTSTALVAPSGLSHFDPSINFNPQSGPPANEYEAFQNYLWDPDTFDADNPPAATDQWFDSGVNAYARPYNKDSFVLISAGPDGGYGTRDDVRNFIR